MFGIWKGWIAIALCAAPALAAAASCSTQSAMQPEARQALATAAGQLAQAVVGQDLTALEAALVSSQKSGWEGIRTATTQLALLTKGGHVELRSLYLLDAAALTAPTDMQFFCANASGEVTVTMPKLPPGRYALALADAAGSAYAGQIGLVLVWEQGWKLGGLSIRPGLLEGHDSLWFWTQARLLASGGANWSAWYSYEAARFLSLPFEILSSPNLEKLNNEQAQLKNPPSEALPLTLHDGARDWKILSVELDPTLLTADLAVVYEPLGLSDPAAQRTEAQAVMSALLRAHPELRANFHGLWAYALKDGKRTAVLELTMAQIPE